MSDISDGEILHESLRQRCVYEVTSEEDQGTAQKWFQYIVAYVDSCIDQAIFGEECAVAQMKRIGINHEKVSKCVQESFVRDKEGKVVDNTILREDAEYASSLGLFIYPSVTINNITYRGDINGYDVFRAVCAGFQTQPDLCKGDNIFNLIKVLDISSPISNRQRHHGIKGLHVLIAIVVVMVINCGALYLYRRHQRQKVNEQLQLQVNSAVSQYFRLSASDSNA